MKICISILCMLFSILSVSGWAFEVDGFTSNMSREEVENNLANWNFDKVDIKDNSIIAYDKPDKTSARLYVFFFENKKLVSVQKNFKPNVKGLIMLFDKFSEIYGSPSSYNSGSDLSSAGESKFITFAWGTKSDTVEMTYTVFESNDQLSVLYKKGIYDRQSNCGLELTACSQKNLSVHRAEMLSIKIKLTIINAGTLVSAGYGLTPIE